MKEAGFEIGDYISVTFEDGKLIIAQDTERAALKAAEEEFMEREMKNLQKRYEAEKRALRAQMVAEPGARWCASMLTEFDEDLFTRFVDRVIVNSRTEIGFDMKCGPVFRERI